MCCAAGRSVKQHYLGSYRTAMVAVLRAQFSPIKAFKGGRAGAARLADNPAVTTYLCHAGDRQAPILAANCA